MGPRSLVVSHQHQTLSPIFFLFKRVDLISAVPLLSQPPAQSVLLIVINDPESLPLLVPMISRKMRAPSRKNRSAHLLITKATTPTHSKMILPFLSTAHSA